MRAVKLGPSAFLAVTGWLAVIATNGLADGAEPGAPRAINPADVARQPAPGTAVPGAFTFSAKGKSLTYLKSESTSLDRVLWKVDLPDGPPRVIARPPGPGDTDETVSREEALRRERQRLRDTGITQVVWAAEAEVAVMPLGGDLYVLRGEGPLERLTNTTAPEIDPQLTADGRQVAFVREGDLYAIDLETRAETRLTEGATDGRTHGLAEFMAQEEMDRSTGFWWSPDGALIAYQETDERHIPHYSIAHQGDDDLSVETHRYPFPGKANARVKLGVVSAQGGLTRWLIEPVEADEEYLARVDWESPVSLLVQLLSRDQRRLRLVRLDVQTGSITRLLEETAATWVNLHKDLRVIEGGGPFLWSSERTGYRHLELRNPDGSLLRTLTSGDWAVDAVVGLDKARREVWFTAGKESPLESHLYRVSLDGGSITRVTSEAGYHRVVVAGNGEAFVDVLSTLEKPPVSTVRDREGERVLTLADSSEDPRIGELSLVAPELVEFSARDGTRLHGAFYAARSERLGKRSPLVVMLYGGPHVQYVTSQWSMTSDMTAQLLADRGFSVWKMDNRGSARRGHLFEASIHRRMGTIEVEDQVDGVRFVTGRFPKVDPERVGVMGGSYGGYMTLRCLAKAADVFRAGVALAPVVDWDGYDTTYTERYMETPSTNPDGYASSSVLGQVESIRGRLLLIHGLLDENVHFRHTARLIQRLTDLDKPYELILLPGERHSTRKESDRRYVAERLTAFFEEAFGPR